jgi:phosphoserine phosphatase
VTAKPLAGAVRGASSHGGIAAFDADGTLWREDVGEAFLRHLIALGWIRLPDGSDPYQAYERVVERDRRTGYAYAAQLQAGLEEARLAAEAERFARAWVPPRLIASVQELRMTCADAGLQLVVVSASPLPIVRAAAPLAGFSDCAGIEVRVRGGKLTDEVVEPVVYAEGKVRAAERFGPLVVACGDSLGGDLALLSAARVPVVVAPEAGSPLATEARRRGWFVLES